MGFELMQAEYSNVATRTVKDVLQYLITIPDVKEAIKADISKVKLRLVEMEGIHVLVKELAQ